MSRCSHCNREFPDGGAFCPYCGTPNAQPLVTPKPPNNRVKITLIIAVAAVVTAAIVIVGLVIANSNRKGNFGITTAQYTADVNRQLGDDLLDENKWVVNGAHAVYQGDDFNIDLDIDLDSNLVQKISISPPDGKTAQKIINATVIIVKTTTYTTVNNYVIFDSASLTSTTTASTTIPQTTEPEKAEYTAMDLIDKSLSEIVELMDGDFECQLDRDNIDYIRSGFGSDGVLWMYNDKILPGFAFHPESGTYQNELQNREIDYESIKDKIRSGNYNFIGIAIRGDQKLNNQISSDMTYSEIASVVGDFEIHCAAQGAFSNHTSINGKDVAFFFEPSDELYTAAKNNKLIVSVDIMRQLNPKLENIVVKKSDNTPSSLDNQTYHNTKYGWSVDIPKEWYEYGIVKESETEIENYLGAVSFYYKEAYRTIHGGHVFTIYAMPNNSVYDDGQTGGNPAGGFLGRNSQYAFYWRKATDVQYDYSGNDREKQSTEYHILSNMRQTILDTFVLDQ